MLLLFCIIHYTLYQNVQQTHDDDVLKHHVI